MVETAFWRGRPALVTGGASFIGSHLTDQLVARGASVRVVDDLSSGKLDNLSAAIDAGVEFVRGDLRDPVVAREVTADRSVVFHLAADHGGRGYIDLHQEAMTVNFLIDQNVFRASLDAGCEKVVYASSGCAYPLHLQSNPEETLYLTEDMVGPPYEPDGIYGLAKVVGELTLKAMHDERGLRSASVRYFTVYGPRGVENHAVMAMIARCLVREDPFTVWGNGEQIRNWTYVDDIVSGTILAAEKIDDATAVNLGTSERVRVIDAVRLAMKMTGHEAPTKLLPDAPTGPMNRVASNDLAKKLMDWEPEVLFEEGLRRTVDWYFSTKKADDVRPALSAALTERGVS
ncbi:MAG TPA: NAD-dependent epimerase/dehydratase family protein [Actinomycetota bacterium]|nr:NAD-dependent epimerase/dehydratase family protein [Actinomycetota bacterium]